MFGLSPDQWDDWSALGLLIFLCGSLGWLILSGRLIPRRQHEELVRFYKEETARLWETVGAQGQTISTQAETIAEDKSVKVAASSILQAMRQHVESGGGP